jgi:cobaltochelatase CobN
MKIAAVLWGSEIPMVREASQRTGIDVEIWATFRLQEREQFARCMESLKSADLILLHPTQDAYWDDLIAGLIHGVPVISFGFDQSHWAASTVPLSLTATVNAYFVYGGLSNMENLLRYLCSEFSGPSVSYKLPEKGLWEGVYHPDAPGPFSRVEDYLEWYGQRHASTVGIFFYRIYWANNDLEVIDALIREFERDTNVIAVFSTGSGDEEVGAVPGSEVIRRFFSGRVDALVSLQSSSLSPDPSAPVGVLRELGVPVFHPVILYYRSEREWEESLDGMSSSELGWSMIMPEMYGMIEMLPVATAMKEGPEGADHDWHQPIQERVKKIGSRVRSWIRLGKKPNHRKKVAIMLNASPCASVEANVGAAAHLDTMQSVVNILTSLREAGYRVECPENGEDLAKTILDRRAVSEFRWTTVEEIVRRGGALGRVDRVTYKGWFDELPPALRERMISAWGRPPGEEQDGIAAAMIYQGELVISGLSYGNAVVCTQPKRGCAGSRCDGQFCRILHDPEVPPPHHYLATYRYLERVFGADVIIHVGTHGTLEFLPGKSVALSQSCLPDAVIGSLPLLYIYNSDNPPEGTIAKRRGSAVLVDHMQTVMASTGPYGILKELEERIAEYRKYSGFEKAKAHAAQHQIIDLIRKGNLSGEVDPENRLSMEGGFEEVLSAVHRVLSEIAGTKIPEGMHVFGCIPEGCRKAKTIASMLDHNGRMRSLVAGMMGLDMTVSEAESALVRVLSRMSEELVMAWLSGSDPDEAARQVLGDRYVQQGEGAGELHREAMQIGELIEGSDEMQGLFSGLSGRYISPGPSGLLSRGRTDILPTGRNFYSLDPDSVPTPAAWEVGKRLAGSLLEKYRAEHGKYPENVAMLWMASDIMWADGEQFAQMLALLGVEPVREGGRIHGFRVIPADQLGRPRIDLTVRASGILRDCFFRCVELLDEAIATVAMLDEPADVNYVRKHSPEGTVPRRIFGSKKGTYGMGVNLAVYSSAWKEAGDLSDIFVYWNGYAYGKGVYGEESREEFIRSLSSVDLTFNKAVTDEYDLLGCCCYFGSHGGMTAAARTLSGKQVDAYYGDTRDTSRVEVRTLAEELRRVARTKLFNPQWIDGLKEHGYSGASEIARRAGRVFGWDATTGEVDDWIFDDIARTFLLDEENRRFFQEHNIWAMEEMGRRLLEANARGMWEPDEDLLEDLKEVYLEIEGSLEDEMGVVQGSMQGGSTDVFSVDEVREWKLSISHYKPVQNSQKPDKARAGTRETTMEKRSESG